MNALNHEDIWWSRRGKAADGGAAGLQRSTYRFSNTRSRLCLNSLYRASSRICCDRAAPTRSLSAASFQSAPFTPVIYGSAPYFCCRSALALRSSTYCCSDLNRSARSR